MDGIREATWIRVSDPSEFIPSIEALRLHWYRSVWIVSMWSQAHSSDIDFLPLQNYGWELNGDFVWECNHNIDEVKKRIQYLTTGCGCKKGCKTRQCRCNAKHQKCGPGMYMYPHMYVKNLCLPSNISVHRLQMLNNWVSQSSQY